MRKAKTKWLPDSCGMVPDKILLEISGLVEQGERFAQLGESQ